MLYLSLKESFFTYKDKVLQICPISNERLTAVLVK